MVKICNDWDNILKSEFESNYYKNLRLFLKNEYKNFKIYPDMFDIFNSLKLTSYSDTKVVILGQDPYHGENQAHGLAFSVKHGIDIPPSLKNIFKEIKSDLNTSTPNHGNLVTWAKRGVLLLNTVLTVRESSPNSHANKGWETFTDNIIKYLNNKNKPIVFILWGRNAINKTKLITNKSHLILTSVHPSPLSAHKGFFGCKHFSKTNNFLIHNNIEPIDWEIKNI